MVGVQADGVEPPVLGVDPGAGGVGDVGDGTARRRGSGGPGVTGLDEELGMAGMVGEGISQAGAQRVTDLARLVGVGGEDAVCGKDEERAL